MTEPRETVGSTTMTEETATSEVRKSSVKTKKTPLTSKQWHEIVRLWESGEVTLETLSKHYERHPSLFTKYFSKNGIKRGSRKAMAIKEAQEKAANVDDANILAARIRETKEDHYKMASGLAKLTWAEVLRVKQDGLQFSSALNNLKALDTATSTLKKLREERFAILGLDKEDFIDEEGLPELVVSELTADQIEDLQKARAINIEEIEDPQLDFGEDEDDEGEDEVVSEGA